MKPVSHDKNGTATIEMTAADAYDLWVAYSNVKDLRERLEDRCRDPVWGLDEGDLEDSTWDGGTGFWCATERDAQLVALYEHAHGYTTMGIYDYTESGEEYITVSTRPDGQMSEYLERARG